MTKEAINILNALKFILNNDQYTDEIEEALDIAIESLQQPDHIADDSKKASYSCGHENDLISRQAAIGIVEFECGEWRGLAKTIAEEIKLLPSAQPERKTGRWIYDGDCYVCSECRSAYGWWADSQTSNYCPNCGADMRGEQDG